MDEQHTEIIAGDGSAAVHTNNGHLAITNNYLTQSGLTKQEIKDKESQYLGWVMESCGGLEWLSLMELQEGQASLALDAVYTALLTKSRHDDQARSVTGMNDDVDPVRQGRLSAVELLNKEQKVVLLGDPGSGKSAFVDFLSLCLAGQYLGKALNLSTLTEPLPDRNGNPQQRKIESDTENSNDKKEPETELVPQQWDHGTLIPLKIILRDFAASPFFPSSEEKPSSQQLLGFIKSEFETHCFDGYFNILKKRLEKGHVLIMFDGLDEVAQAGDRRKRLVACIDLFSKSFSQCRFLVTCRPYAYRDPDWQLSRFTSDELAEFDNGQVIRFIQLWYQHLPAKDRDKTIARGKQLQTAVLGRPALRDLAKRPLLLSLIAYLHGNQYTLPDRRADLYEELIKLLLDKWESARFKVGSDDIDQAKEIAQTSLVEYLQMGKESILTVLKRLAFEAHALQDGDKETADISARDLHDQLLEAADKCKHSEVRVLELAGHLRDRVGILYQRSGSTATDAIYTFPHRSFQEYLAAEYFRVAKGAVFESYEKQGFEFDEYTWQELAAKLARADPDRWREVVVLAGGIRSKSDVQSVWGLLKELSLYNDLNALTKEEAWGLRLASEILLESASLVDKTPREDKIFRKTQTALPYLLGTENLPAKERAQAGRNLARIGDPRPEVMEVDAMQFCFVPKGEFWMGRGEFDEEREEALSEAPAGKYDISYDYWVAKSPVTTAQFKAFVSETGFEVGDSDALKELENAPVVWVSQIEAQKYCEWLTQRWHKSGLLQEGWKVCLPNEPEWEKAARGGFEVPVESVINTISELPTDVSITLIKNEQPQRRYPSVTDIDKEVVNYQMNVGGTTTIGTYPLGQSLYGCHDLSGNVWEWTRTQKNDYPFPAVGTQAWKDLEAQELSDCVLRGGAFGGLQDHVRCAVRDDGGPDYRYSHLGFRVILSPLL